MKKVISLILVYLLLSGFANHGMLKSVIARKNVAAGTTNYTQDANCMGAYFMNSSTTETDRSVGGSQDLVVASSPNSIPTSATVPAGYSGTSRDFEDDDTERLEVEDGGTLDINGAGQPITVAAWMRLETDNGVDASVFSKANQYRLYFDTGNNAIQFTVNYNGSSATTAIGATTINTGTWYHIAGTHDGSQLRVYVNGSEDTNGGDNPKNEAGDGINDSSTGPAIGTLGRGSTSFPFDGLLDEEIVFDRALSEAEIADIMANGIDGSKGGND